MSFDDDSASEGIQSQVEQVYKAAVEGGYSAPVDLILNYTIEGILCEAGLDLINPTHLQFIHSAFAEVMRNKFDYSVMSICNPTAGVCTDDIPKEKGLPSEVGKTCCGSKGPVPIG